MVNRNWSEPTLINRWTFRLKVVTQKSAQTNLHQVHDYCFELNARQFAERLDGALKFNIEFSMDAQWSRPTETFIRFICLVLVLKLKLMLIINIKCDAIFFFHNWIWIRSIY